MKKPAIYPIIVLYKQFNPNGLPLKKSIKTPDTKPETSPNKLPLLTEKYKIQINNKSGMAGKKSKLDNTAVSIKTEISKIEKQNK